MHKPLAILLYGYCDFSQMYWLVIVKCLIWYLAM
ncbi:Auxin efflux carrier component 3 -like protein [Gossypium arboreum]|uniref:Auxin efflux carrier component 3-like protein n=1 Tax=Gossypium arboreum TaxID=29729 RepID=A0A0B0PLR0_GOSAR|nr:Auxin efflux carrier component 3 -like protein [Gossypium arboreum]